MDVTGLAAEVEQLRAELEAVSEELEIERAHRHILQRAVLRLRSVEETGGSGDDGDVLSLDSDRPDKMPDNMPKNMPENMPENMYVFDDEDASRAAFDEFFATPDPHLDKVRGFLLD